MPPYSRSFRDEFIRVEITLNDLNHLLADLYFCSQCSKLCSKLDLLDSHEMYYCPCCLEGLMPLEAMAYGMRCTKCFECPRCFSVLSMSSSTVNQVLTYYFACGTCQWDSKKYLNLGFNTPGGLIIEMNRLERECVRRQQFLPLVNVFRKASLEALREQQIKATVKTPSLAHYLGAGLDAPSPLTKHTGIWRLKDLEEAVLSKERDQKTKDIWSQSYPAGLIPMVPPCVHLKTIMNGSHLNEGAQDASIALQSPDSLLLNAEFLNRPIATSASMWQLVRAPYDLVFSLPYAQVPERHPLLSRISRKCKICKQLIVKNNKNLAMAPSFEINDSAMYWVPRVYVSNLTTFRENSQEYVDIAISNPLLSPVQLEFILNTENASGSSNTIVLTSNFKTSLEGFDEVLEMVGDTKSELLPEDDKEVILKRKLNRILCRLKMQVKSETLGQIGYARFTIIVAFTDLEGKGHTIPMPLCLSLGRICTGRRLMHAESI